MTRLRCFAVCLLFCVEVKAQDVPDTANMRHAAPEMAPDTTNLKQYMAEVDSLLRMDAILRERRGLEAQAGMDRAAQRRMMESMRYVRLGKMFELGPVSRIVTRNSIDGFCPRFGGRTTAELHPRLFFQGYYSRGFKSGENYFSARAVWSFNKKRRQPDEYPQRAVSVMAMRDIGLPFEIFNNACDDNFLTSLRWTQVGEFVRFDRRQLGLDYDFNRTLKVSAQMSVQKAATVGGWDEALRSTVRLADVALRMDVRTAERSVLSLSHRTGIKGLLRCDYNYNITELAYTGRVTAGRGSVGIGARAGMQWNAVPFPLLCMPAANMAYISVPSTFMLVNNYEFANDRYLSMMLDWDCGGALLSRVPFLRMLGCHETLGFRSLWGAVSGKNDYGISRMDGGKPYCECSVGICNILGFVSVEYVRRLNYLNLPTAHKHGVRIGLLM